MAQAVQELYPDAKLTIGPPLEDRFYYDIDVESISEDDFAKIEAKMMELAKQDLPIVCETIARDEALTLFADNPYNSNSSKRCPKANRLPSTVRAPFWICVAARTCLRPA